MLKRIFFDMFLYFLLYKKQFFKDFVRKLFRAGNNFVLQGIHIHSAALSPKDFTRLEKHESGNASHFEFGCNILIFIDVNFDDSDFIAHFVFELI